MMLAAALLDAPIAAVAMSMGGKYVLRSLRDGLITERPRAACGEAELEMGEDGTLVITDLTSDPRTADNAFVRGPSNCRFYAGASIHNEEGARIGSLCVLDTSERAEPSTASMGLLRMLADQAGSAVAQLDLMRSQQEKAELLHLAEDLLGLGHWRFDFTTGQSTWSDAVYKIHGLDRATFDPSRDNPFSAYHPEDRQIILGHVERARATGKGYECRLRLVRPDGSERITLSTGRCLLDAEGFPLALFGVFQDITDTNAAEQRLRESEERFRLLASNATDIVTKCDLEGRFNYVSPAVTTVTGYTEDEVVGKHALDFVHPDDRDRVEQEIGRALSSPGVTQIEHRHVRKDGVVIWIQSRPRLAFDPVTGKPNAVTDVMRDVTAQKAAEAELIVARAAAEEASQIKSDFLANMSHEIRTPLTAILGFSSLLTDRDDISDDARVHIGRVAKAGDALLGIVNDVLDFSKLEAGQYELRAEPCDPVEVCHEALLMFAPMAHKKDIALEFRNAEAMPAQVEIDAHRLRQILINLVGNALKFTDAGAVCVSLAYDPSAQSLEVSVRDTGSGMDEEQCGKLFKRFSQVDASSTRRHGGTGLGLAICKGLSEAMGGGIGVTSTPGDGSTFTFTISAPVSVAESSRTLVKPLIDVSRLESLRLLVVDDNPANREIAAALLRSQGIETYEAVSGHDAIEVAGRQPFDVILMDQRMPGMSGAQAARSIRDLPGPNQFVPILAFSADAQTESDQFLGFDGLVSKPIILSDLLQTIAECLGLDADTEPTHSVEAA